MAGQFQTMDEYIHTFPEDVRKILNELRQTIKEAAPGAEETINYQIDIIGNSDMIGECSPTKC